MLDEKDHLAGHVEDDVEHVEKADDELVYDNNGYLTGSGMFRPNEYPCSDVNVHYIQLDVGKWSVHCSDKWCDCHGYVYVDDDGKLKTTGEDPDRLTDKYGDGFDLEIEIFQDYFVKKQ